MAKTSGMGDDLYFGGYRIGGDIQSLTLAGGPALLDVTDITQSAHSRLGGLRDGNMSLTAYMDTAAAAEHAAFSPLTRSDVIVTYLRGQAIGNPAACCNALQLNYDPTRGADGALNEKVDVQSDGYGLEWGEQLTAGLRTDTTDTNGATQEDAAATSNGGSAYLQAVAITGTSATVEIEHSTNGTSWTALASFTAVASAPQAQRITFSGSVDQYVRVITTGTFTNFEFQVTFCRFLVPEVF